MLHRFHPFGDDAHAERARQADDGAHQVQVFPVHQHGAYEALVDLQRVCRQPLEVGQRRIAGAEIVQREADALLLAGQHDGAHVGDVAQGRRFEYFQLQHGRRHVREFGQYGAQALDEIGALEMAPGDVDADHPVRHVGPPRLQLAQRLAQHPFADVDDDVAVLDDRQEVHRPHQPPLRMLPAQQRFHADDAAGAHVELGLVVQPQLAGAQRGAHLRAAVVVGAHLFVQVGVEEVETLAARDLGLVQGLVGVAQQEVGAGLGAGVDGHAHAGRHLHHFSFAQVVAFQRGHQALQHGGDGVAFAKFGQQQHEFIAAQARHVLAVLGQLVQAAGHLLEQGVTHGLAQAVVDVLEVVEVEQAHGQPVMAVAGARDLVLEAGRQRGAVGQAGEDVVIALP